MNPKEITEAINGTSEIKSDRVKLFGVPTYPVGEGGESFDEIDWEATTEQGLGTSNLSFS